MKKSESKLSKLRDISFLNELDIKDLKKISSKFFEEKISMGETLHTGGVLPEFIKILIDGQVRFLAEHPSTKSLVSLNIASPNYVVGWFSTQIKENKQLITAATDCVFLTIKLSDWLDLINRLPSIIKYLNNKIFPEEVWYLLISKKSIHIPEKSKDLKNYLRNISLVSNSITLFNKKDGFPDLDKNSDWFISSKIEKFQYGEIINLKKFKLINDFPLRIIGIPKELINYRNKRTFSSYKSETIISDIEEKALDKDFVYKDRKKSKSNNKDKDVTEKSKYPEYKFYGSSEDKILEAIACFRMLGNILNIPIKVDIVKRFLVENIKNKKTKVSLPLIAAFSESLGLKTQILELPINLLGRLKSPSFLQFENDELCILMEVKKEKLLIARPQFGIKSYELNDLIEFSSSDKKIKVITLQKSNRTPTNNFNLKWFLPSIKKNKKPLIEVLVASLFVQLFQLMNPLIIQQIIDKVLGQGGINTLPVLAILIFAFSIFENILTAVRTNLFIDTTNRIDISLGEQVIDHLLRLPLSYFDKRPVGELSTRLGELEQIRSFLTSTALTVLLDSVFSIIYIAVMLAYSWILTIVALLVAPILAAITLSVSPIVRRQLRKKAELNANTQNHLVEVITGIQTVKAQNFELKARWKWKDRYTKYISESFKNAVTSTTYSSLTQFLNQFSSLAVLCVGSYLVLQGNLTLGQLIAFRIISGYVTGPLLRLANLYQNFQQTNISIERLSDIINTPQESSFKDSVNIPMPKILGELECKDLSFGFSDKGPLNISRINLKISKGQFVAIVGESGSGKSTLTKLFARLYDPSEGKILIDKIDISKVELNSLRSQIGIVPQDSILFDGSVQENISLTDPEASSEEIINASKIACAHDFIMDLSYGYASDVGERGSNLSGGQRQRIAIARSILQNPNLLIMDESTSALDYKTERKVSLNLMEFFRGKTVLFITHRLSSIVHADLIVTMHQGRIEEVGNHSELMSMKGRYYSLYKQQGKFQDDF